MQITNIPARGNATMISYPYANTLFIIGGSQDGVLQVPRFRALHLFSERLYTLCGISAISLIADQQHLCLYIYRHRIVVGSAAKVNSFDLSAIHSVHRSIRRELCGNLLV